MRLTCITDLHDSPSALDRILAQAGQADLVLLGGDITSFGSPRDAERLVRQAQLSGAPVLAVAGNCDSADIERRLAELGVSLFRRATAVGRVGLHGLSAMPPWQSRMYHFSERELAEHLEDGHRQLLGKGDTSNSPGGLVHVVLSHAPPRDCRLDRTFLGRHVGSEALREFIDRTQPALVLCGHIHEGRGVETLGRTTVVNCGAAAGGSYALVEIGQDVRVELRQA